MKKKILILSVSLTLLTLMFSGCRSDYSANAVERARTYALENLPGITSSQRAFVKFTQPEIYENLIFPQYVMPADVIGHIKKENYNDFPIAPHLDLMHSCVVWSPPDLGAKIVVVGDGQRNMHNWFPKRVMVKRYGLADPNFVSAVTACQVHAQNNMLYLTTPLRNRIRFSEPAETVFTKFDIALPHAKEMAGRTDWEKYLDELRDASKEYSQISLVWKGIKDDECVVFTGLTTSGTLKGWRLQTAELMPTAKLTKNLLSREEIQRITIEPYEPPELTHPKQEKIERADPAKVTPDTPVEGGSFIFKR